MLTSSSSQPPARADLFSYVDYEIDEAAGSLRCRYRLDEIEFVETFLIPDAEGSWSPAAREAARIVFLLAGISYYKAGAPPIIDLGPTPTRTGDIEFLHDHFVHGLGEFAYENELDLGGIEIVGGVPAIEPPPPAPSVDRLLVPFGGGIDSLVTVDAVSGADNDVALFIVSRPEAPFAVIETAARATGLPIRRALRSLDDRLLQPRPRDSFFNGHVPITGIISALAVLAAVLDGRGTVVMSNEWSASKGNLEAHGRVINHQYSKSISYERAFRDLLATSFETEVNYFSFLRPRSELWVARRFAELKMFHPVVHSCNRAFHLDPDLRQDGWCGLCDKCCFIDLILSPFMTKSELSALFDGREPLQDPTRIPQFRSLLGLGPAAKPFECVGDVDECRAATMLAAQREDRRSDRVLSDLVSGLGMEGPTALNASERLLEPLGEHWIPDALFEATALD